MAVDTDQKYQEKVETAPNMLYQPKQKYHINKGHAEIAIPAVGGVAHMSIYSIL